MSRRMSEWIFTFCGNHIHKNGFVVISGTYSEAREEMFSRYGDKWAFQYESREKAGVSRFNLYEINDKHKANFESYVVISGSWSLTKENYPQSSEVRKKCLDCEQTGLMPEYRYCPRCGTKFHK